MKYFILLNNINIWNKSVSLKIK